MSNKFLSSSIHWNAMKFNEPMLARCFPPTESEFCLFIDVTDCDLENFSLYVLYNVNELQHSAMPRILFYL